MSKRKAKGGERGQSREERRQEALIEQIATLLKSSLKGSLVETQIRCGRPQCRGTRGERPPALHLSYSRGGRSSRRVYMPRRHAKEAATWIANRREVRRLLEEVFELNIVLLKAQEGES